MGDRTKIEWCDFPGYIPATWNPIIGCTPISEGCDHCYATAMVKRFFGRKGWPSATNVTGRHGKIAYFRERIDQPLHWKKPRAIFVCSLSDLFHEDVPFIWINEIWMQIFNNPEHLFLILTKRPERLLEWTRSKVRATMWPESEIWPENVLLGVTAENQEMANERIPIFLSVPCQTRFVSCEPLLTPVDLTDLLVNTEFISDGRNNDYLCTLTVKGHEWQTREYTLTKEFRKLDWVICGGESGPQARPMDLSWAMDLRDQCKEAGVPFFMKQICEKGRKVPFEEWPDDLKIREFPEVKTC